MNNTRGFLSRRRALALLAVALGLAVLIVLWPRGTPEEQVVSVLTEIADAAERKDVGGCMRHVSQDYHDSRGNTKTELTRQAWGGFRQVGELAVALYVTQVTVEKDQATVHLGLEVEECKEGAQPRTVSTSVTVKLRKERWRWRVVNAEGWQTASDELEQL